MGNSPIDTPFTVLVTGGRDYADRDTVFRALDRLHRDHPNMTVLQGGASGADALAHAWALERERPSITVPAEWGKHGDRAGPIRNALMLAYLPNGVVGFPGGIGTADMCRQAERAELRVWYPAGRA